MKLRFLLYLTAFLFTHTSFAIPADLIHEDDAHRADTPLDESIPVDPFGLFEKYNWLYKIMMHQNDRSNLPSRSKRSFVPHLRDKKEFFPHPDEISTILKLKDGIYPVIGKLKYVRIFPKKYFYTVVKKGNEFEVYVRVFFTNATLQQVAKFKKKFQKASDYWNQFQTQANMKLKFKFEVVTDHKKAHFKVRMVDNTRGPYDTEWDKDWSYKTVAHELGHMMGVGDEYQTLSGKIDCLRKSLMCVSFGTPQKQHYYHILRRLLLSI